VKKKTEILFLGESTLQRIKNYILNIIGIAIIVYCGFHFNENPLFVSIVIIVIILMLSLPGHSMIVVYSDRIDFLIKHEVVSKLSKLLTFSYEDIQSIDVHLQFTRKQFFIGEILSSSIFSLSHWNTINIKMIDGTKKTINTKLYKDDIIKALKIVEKNSYNKIEITGI
jgi:hypothetical protein